MIFSEILIIVYLIILNGLFSMSEIAVVSSRKERLLKLSQDGNKKAEVALELANDPNTFLSTIQVAITLIGILAGAYGGATLSKQLSEVLDKISFINQYSDFISLVVVVSFITYLSVIFGEIIPKRLALLFPEKIAVAIARPMLFISRMVYPVIKIISYSTDKVLNIFGVKEPQEPQITEEEILTLLEIGKQSGAFEEEEKTMIDNVFSLNDRVVSSIMTPRNKIEWINSEDSIEDITSFIYKSNHTILPYCEGSLEQTIGIIQIKKLTCERLTIEVHKLDNIAEKPLYIPESITGFKALKLFKESGTRFALVVDEYGVVQGVLTITDIFEAIVGDIPTQEELVNPQVIKREDGTWLIDGMIDVSEFKDIFEISELEDENTGNYNTLGGFVTYMLGRVPQASEHFLWDKYRFEVLDMDINRVDKVLLSIVK